MFQILTPFNKVERVSRQVDPSTFLAVPGVWAYVAADGSIINVPTSVNNLINKLVIGNASGNIYESHDVEVGRITTMESIGVRYQVGTEGYTGTPVQGDFMVVCSQVGKEGKLISLKKSIPGTYEVVARCEEVNSVDETIIVRTVSPEVDVNAISASSSTSPSSSESASTSPSSSNSASISPSASTSPSSSTSSSISPSASTSPSSSKSASTSPSSSKSASTSPSSSESASTSPSSSESPSTSPSSSPSEGG